MKICQSLLCSLFLAVPLAAQAETVAPEAETFPLVEGAAAAPELVFGHRTRGWLDIQRTGHHAAPAPVMSGAVAGRIYQRYLESFEYPLPEFFTSEARGSFSTGGQ